MKQAFYAQCIDFCSSLTERLAAAERRKYGWKDAEWNESTSRPLAHYDGIQVGESRRFRGLLQSGIETVKMLTSPAQSLDMSLLLAFVMRAKMLIQKCAQKARQ